MVAAAIRGLTVLLVLVLTWLPAGCQASGSRQPPAAVVAPSRPTGRLQEVAPPATVLELQERLAQHQPRVTILSPPTDSLLPPGPWELVIALEDWPQVQMGTGDWGPHLVVQLDREAPLRLVATEGSPLHIPMAALSPGSHRLTAYAARPWGEAVKDPGASAQIRLHRVAVEPLGLPESGSPQLIPVSTTRASEGQPALIDWLLLEAPLQHLREGDESWRLRITVNGDSFLVDQNLPLWLKGLRSGSNAVVLELLDRLGAPLNPPFNSIVQELVLDPGPPMGWQRSGLSEDELNEWLRLNQPTPPPAAPTAPPVPAPPLTNEPASPDRIDTPVPTDPAPLQEPSDPVDTPRAASVPQESAPRLERSPMEPPAAGPPSVSAPPQATAAPSGIEPNERREVDRSATVAEPGTEASTETQESPLPPSPSTSPPTAAGLPNPLRARDLVNPDGSLVDQQPRGLLDRLRARFAG